jgi:hypothetical protein
VDGFDESPVYRNLTKAKARFRCWKALQAAGYKVPFGDIKITEHSDDADTLKQSEVFDQPSEEGR